MKPKIIFFLLLFAGVGAKAKAEGTVGSNVVRIVSGNASRTYPFLRTKGFRYPDEWISSLILYCHQAPKEVICPVSGSEFTTEDPDIMRISIMSIHNAPEASLFSIILAGAIVGASAVGILEVFKIVALWRKLLRDPEEKQEGSYLTSRHSEGTLGLSHSLNKHRYSANLVDAICLPWLRPNSLLPLESLIFFAKYREVLETILQILLGAGVGAVVGPILYHILPKETVAVVLEIISKQSAADG